MGGWLTGGMPAFTSVSGIETIEVDTNLAGGAAPQSVGLNLNQLAPRNKPRNLLDCGDFTTNPWQRGTSFTGITSTGTYTADRWFAVGGGSSSISVSRQAITNGVLPRFGYALQFGRAAANADVAAIKLGQIIETSDSIRLQGTTAVLSVWLSAGANFSAAGGVVTATVYGGTGVNQSLANLLAGTWTNQVTLFSGTLTVTNTAFGPRFVLNNPDSKGIAQGISIPTTITQLAVVFSYVPAGTAGANDWLQFAGLQLEVGTNPSMFEHQDAQLAIAQAQRFCKQLNEPAATAIVGTGLNTSTTTQALLVPFDTSQMIKAPTVSVSAGSFTTNQAGSATATTITAGSAHGPAGLTILGSSSGVAGQGTVLTGGGGAGYIRADAEF